MKIKAKPFAELDSAKQADGLIPAVIQDDRTLQVLMLGYMNREAYEKSLTEGRVTFYSRTRGCLWTKGETSGNYLDIVSVTADCDDDTLLIRVVPHGPTCHTGAKSCFAGAAPETEGFIRYLQSVIRGRDIPRDDHRQDILRDAPLAGHDVLPDLHDLRTAGVLAQKRVRPIGRTPLFGETSPISSAPSAGRGFR